MTSAIAVLTYNRLDALQECYAGLLKCCPDYPIAIFEDAGIRDSTVKTMTAISEGDPVKRPEMHSTEYKLSDRAKFFVGEKNLGVAGNSNRALKWFMEETDADHLCLLNDDTLPKGDFVQLYQRAHEDLWVGLLCFCDFQSDAYRSFKTNSRGWQLKILTRMTGIMMSITRPLVERIGYYDVRFGKFGEEHCDYTNRARFAGFIDIDGRPMHCLDIEKGADYLTHQQVPTSVDGGYRTRCDQIAHAAMQEAASRYATSSHYRPYSLFPPRMVGAYGGGGIKEEDLTNYAKVG